MAFNSFALWSDMWALQGDTYKLSGIQLVVTFPSPQDAEDFLPQLSLRRVPPGGSLHVFREGICPVYDDPHHRRGGHFKMQVLKLDVAQGCWLPLAYAFMNGLLPYCNCVTGVTYMRAHQTQGFKVWLSDSKDRSQRAVVREAIQATLGRDVVFSLKFSPHKYILRPSSNSDSDDAVGRVQRLRVDSVMDANSSASESSGSSDLDDYLNAESHPSTSFTHRPYAPNTQQPAATFSSKRCSPDAFLGDGELSPMPVERIRGKLSLYTLAPEFDDTPPVALLSWLLLRNEMSRHPPIASH